MNNEQQKLLKFSGTLQTLLAKLFEDEDNIDKRMKDEYFPTLLDNLAEECHNSGKITLSERDAFLNRHES